MEEKFSSKSESNRSVSLIAPPIDAVIAPLVDSSMRLVLRLIKDGDLLQLRLRTGIYPIPGEKYYALPVLVELDMSPDDSPFIDRDVFAKFKVPDAYIVELQTNNNKQLRHVTASIDLVGQEIFNGDITSMVNSIKELLGKTRRLSLGVPAQSSLAGSIRDIGLPVDRLYKGYRLTGDKVIVGIVDDGCALAKWNFLKPTQNGQFQSRICFLWDQAAGSQRPGGWLPPDRFPYGLEITQAKIDKALNHPGHSTGGVIDEAKVHKYLHYELSGLASHGTRVMDIAAGNGQSIMDAEGVACGADIIFVQLPTRAIERGRAALWKDILDGITYIFDRANVLGLPAVVNVSYGGYDGPHDGTGHLEAGIDALLALPGPARSVVVSAGNGFEANCHSMGDVQATVGPPAMPTSLQWVLLADDPTNNDLEIWYAAGASLKVRLTIPGGATSTDWIALGEEAYIQRPSDNAVVGYIDHKVSHTTNLDNRVHITLGPTDRPVTKLPGAATKLLGPAPSGQWLVEIWNFGAAATSFHAWISRDDSGRPGGARRQQSHFVPEHADPRYTIAGIATGSLTISVGAHNVPTQQICRYSACGPTRPIGNAGQSRRKPEVYAPAEEDVAGAGVLAASSQRSRPTRINGTSAAAPHVAGAIALMLQYAAIAGVAKSAAQIRDAVNGGADANTLTTDLHQQVDVQVPIKQTDVLPYLSGYGKFDWMATMKLLFP